MFNSLDARWRWFPCRRVSIREYEGSRRPKRDATTRKWARGGREEKVWCRAVSMDKERVVIVIPRKNLLTYLRDVDGRGRSVASAVEAVVEAPRVGG